jgi:hypothetical protein
MVEIGGSLKEETILQITLKGFLLLLLKEKKVQVELRPKMIRVGHVKLQKLKWTN